MGYDPLNLSWGIEPHMTVYTEQISCLHPSLSKKHYLQEFLQSACFSLTAIAFNIIYSIPLALDVSKEGTFNGPSLMLVTPLGLMVTLPLLVSSGSPPSQFLP